jgi:hypothetical protein
MLAAHHLLKEVIASLRNVIAPAVADPYPKSQAYMAAVILEFIARQVEERSDSSKEKEHVLEHLFSDLRSLITDKVPFSKDPDQEARLCRLIEWLYTEKDRLGPEAFTAANQKVRTALRQLLDQELKIAGTKE